MLRMYCEVENFTNTKICIYLMQQIVLILLQCLFILLMFFRRKKIYMLDTKFHPTCTLVWIWHFIIVSSIDDDDYVLYYGYDL